MISSARIVAAIALCALLGHASGGGPIYTDVVRQDCSADNPFPFKELYDTCLRAGLDDVVTGTAGHDYSYNVLNMGNYVCYLHGACNGVLYQDECTSCLKVALAKMREHCPDNNGAKTVLVDCRIRYEIYEFDDNY